MDKGGLCYAAQPVKQRPNQTQARFATRVKLAELLLLRQVTRHSPRTHRDHHITVPEHARRYRQWAAEDSRQQQTRTKNPDNNREEPRTQPRQAQDRLSVKWQGIEDTDAIENSISTDVEPRMLYKTKLAQDYLASNGFKYSSTGGIIAPRRAEADTTKTAKPARKT